MKHTPSIRLSDCKRPEFLWPALAFAIPFVLMWLGFAVHGVFPFGDRQVLVTDAWHQYYPFLVDLHTKLRSGDSLLYTWNNGMGTNYLSLAAYYCASPLNLLVVLFPAFLLKEAFALLVTLKIGLSGLFFALCMRGAYGRCDVTLTVFGSFYALSSFFMGYYWNIMWLDTAALLPLVAWGTLALVREGRFRLYVLSLALALVCNYLIGLYVCIFVFFLFFILCICEKLSLRRFGKRFVQIALFTLIALSLTAFLLYPAWLGLADTHSAATKFPDWKLTESFADILGNLASFGGPTAKEGLPNIACGLPCVLLGGVYAASPRVSRRQKVCALFLLVLLLVSMNVSVIEYVWNGFHVTNMLPFRFSFLFSFVLCALGFQAAPDIFSLSRRAVVVTALLSAALLGLAFGVHGTLITALNAAMIVVYAGTIFFLRRRPRTMALVLCLTVLGELTATAIVGVDTVRTTTRSSFPENKAEVSALLEELESSDSGFYRVESVPYQSLNDPAMLGYRGVSTFSSTANARITRLTQKLGLAAASASNRYYYPYLSTPLVNALTGVKYLIDKDNTLIDPPYLEKISEINGVVLYENTAALPVGFMGRAGMAAPISANSNPLLTQNAVFTAATGVEDDLFELLDMIHVGHENLSVSRRDLGRYSYSLKEEVGDGILKFNYEMPRAGALYAYIDCPNLDTLTILHDEDSRTQTMGNLPFLFCVGAYEAGEIVSLKWNVGQEVKDNTSLKIFVGVLNEEVFDKGYQTLADETLEITNFTSTSLSGTITVREEGLFCTSIPYEAGWTLTVDGQEREITPWQDAFIALEGLTPDTHTIELTYTPAGFLPGVAVTLTGLALFAAAVWLEKRRKAV